jgi:endo-1,4-beta-xylanase
MTALSCVLMGWAALCPAAPVQDIPSLKDVFKDDFRIGAAISPATFNGTNAKSAALVVSQFNTISPENVLKWEAVHPRIDGYNFAPADAYVDFGVRNGMFVVGHTLVWLKQTPAWVFEDGAGKPASRELLLQRMHDHISTVVGRYKGKIRGWDVVNEAIAEDGSIRDSKWREIIGDDYIEKAYEFAHEADPSAELYYNEFNAWKPSKRDGIIRLIKQLQAKGIPIKAVGMQGHLGIDYPATELVESAIVRYAALGVKVNVTEFDIDLLPNPTGRQGSDIGERFAPVPGFDPYTEGLPVVMEHRLAERYADLFRVFLRHADDMDRITFWGVSDAASWLNGWPMGRRTSYPLLFDRKYEPKLAFDVVVDLKRFGLGK